MRPASPPSVTPRWSLAPPCSREELLAAMSEFSVPPALGQVLHARGLTRAHLFPARALTPNPGLTEAARRLVQAIRSEKTIRVHGDYDADGVSGAALLVLGLRRLGADVHGFIPHRLNEGYGLHLSRVAEHAAACDLLLTVDCGVSNLAEVEALLSEKVEVIVTDHHSPGPSFPDCLVVHPQLTAGYDPELHNLTGAGVAYHLLWAVRQELGEGEPLEYAPLATLGTIADVAPLLGENRALVMAGLERFPATELPGLQALMDPALGGPATAGLSAHTIGFVLAPRINAAGRLGEADLALELLTTDSRRRADELAIYLETRNRERRDIQDKMMSEALELVDPADPAIVLTREGWHPGVMGIVAAKLLEVYHRPVYIVAEGKGSVRSTPGISAVGGLHHAADLLSHFGGHPAAAGFSLRDGQFGPLRGRLHDYARGFPAPVPELRLDGLLPACGVCAELGDGLESLEPFGQGTPSPLWHLRGELDAQRLVGKTSGTLQFSLAGVRGVKFRQPAQLDGTLDVAAQVQRSEFRGQVRLELMAEGLRPAGALGLAETSAPPAFSHLNPRLNPPRLHPKEAMAHLRAGAWAYAEGAVAEYLQGNIPGVRLLEPGQELAGEVVLYALPPETDLKGWLAQATGGKGRVSFAWGPKTLGELEESYSGRERGAEKAADAYRRWQWAQLYRTLDDAGWAGAAAALLGLEAGRELASVAD